MAPVLVLDNGGDTVKAALVNGTAGPGITAGSHAGTSASEYVCPNALARVGKTALSFPRSALGRTKRPQGFLVGSEIHRAPDFGAMLLRRPHERGFVTQWDAQRDVWASVFSEDVGFGLGGIARPFSDMSLLLTEPLGVPMHTRVATDELVFEEFGFGRAAVANPARLVAGGGESALVLDSGFSFTHAVPVVGGRELAECARRLNIGGKALTNQLKRVVSYRSWNMMDETVVMNAVKERLCYVSMDYMGELAATKKRENPFRRDYILPDLSTIGADPLGHVRRDDEALDGSEQVLVMNNERMSIPELLFTPSDAGISQGGVAEMIHESVLAAPEEFRAELYANIVLVGGNCLFQNFADRLVQELRPLVSSIYDVNVSVSDNPVLAALRGGVQAVSEEETPLYRMVTKMEYEEEGSHALAAKLYAGDEVEVDS